VTKYDDVSWHCEDESPEAMQAAAAPIAMFVTWCILRGLASDLHLRDFGPLVERLRGRAASPAEHVLAMDGKFSSGDLNSEGNRFAAAYYAREEGGYYDDYAEIERSALGMAANSWQRFDQVAARIDERFREWRSPKKTRTKKNQKDPHQE
jgi:hypothetical protein